MGRTLTADTSGIADENGLASVDFSHQWMRSDTSTDTNIENASSGAYTLTRDDLGERIRVRVSFTDDDGYDEEMTSATTTAVAVNPHNTPAAGAPTISGIPVVGDVLTAYTSGITDLDGISGVSFSYQWMRDVGTTTEEVIGGATSSTYTLVSDDEDKTVSVRVRFADESGYSEELFSAPTETVGSEPDWRATITAAPLYLDHGYSGFTNFEHGSLTSETFEIDEVTYIVKVIEASGWFYIGFDKEMPVAFTLAVDETLLESSDASFESYSYGAIYRWQDAGVDWGDGQRVELMLHVRPSS